MPQAVTVVIPTFNGGALFAGSLEAIRSQRFFAPLQILVLDSGSRDGTPDVARRHGAEVIEREESAFHHARTRNHALGFARHPLVLFTVQDAVPIGTDWLSKSVAALADDSITAAFGRQVPHEEADLFARYTTERHSEFLGSRRRVYSFLPGGAAFESASFESAMTAIPLDNVCAIYRRRALEEIPFPEFSMGEDLAWCLSAQRRGHRILYEPSLRIHHSHNRSPDYDFRRALTGFVCIGQIVGKVPRDRSLLGMPEVLEMERHLVLLQAEMLARSEPGGGELLLLLARRIRNGLSRRFRIVERSFRGSELQLEMQATMWIQYIDARRRYPGTSVENRKRFLARLASFELGKFVAEIFLSRAARKTIPQDLAAFVASNMKGV